MLAAFEGGRPVASGDSRARRPGGTPRRTGDRAPDAGTAPSGRWPTPRPPTGLSLGSSHRMLEPPQTPRSKQATLFQTHPELHSARGAALKEQAVTQESPGATKGSGSSNLPGYDASVANAARIWNYWIGGKDHFRADREAGDQVLE